MSVVYFPSCKLTAQYKESAVLAREYVSRTFGVKPVGCCRPGHKKLTGEDTALVWCNNCANIIEENSEAQIKFLWEVIDEDETFVFPDYKGRKMTVQDCWLAADRPQVHRAVRSLMKKMNIDVVELPENGENTRFCGDLLGTCKPDNARLVPGRYVEKGSGMFLALSDEKKKIWIDDYCRRIPTEEVVCYCLSCEKALKSGGKEAKHIFELLFPPEGE